MTRDDGSRLVPVIKHTKRPTGRDEGYEIYFGRINKHNERSATTFVVSELSLEDLLELEEALSRYLDEGRYQE